MSFLNREAAGAALPKPPLPPPEAMDLLKGFGSPIRAAAASAGIPREFMGLVPELQEE